MTNEEKEKYIENLIVEWRNKLHLYNWNIKYRLVENLSLNNDYGETTIEAGILRATVEICRRCPEEEIKEVIIHELLHLWVYWLIVSVEAIIEELSRPPEKIILFRSLKREEEKVIENLTRVFIDLDEKESE